MTLLVDPPVRSFDEWLAAGGVRGLARALSREVFDWRSPSSRKLGR